MPMSMVLEKSTLYHSGIWRINGFSSEMRRVNSDEILRSKNGDWSSTGDQLAAMREAVRRIDEYY